MRKVAADGHADCWHRQLEMMERLPVMASPVFHSHASIPLLLVLVAVLCSRPAALGGAGGGPHDPCAVSAPAARDAGGGRDPSHLQAHAQPRGQQQDTQPATDSQSGAARGSSSEHGHGCGVQEVETTFDFPLCSVLRPPAGSYSFTDLDWYRPW